MIESCFSPNLTDRYRIPTCSLHEAHTHREKELVWNWSTCKAYSICMVFLGMYGGMVSIMPYGLVYGMVWYVSKHSHKDNSETFGSVLGRLEAFQNRYLSGYKF